MKKFILPVLAVISIIQFNACNTASNNTDENGVSGSNSDGNGNSKGKYKLEAAIVTSKITNSMMTGDITNILYFDDHGEKEMTKTVTKISMMGQNIETTSYGLTKDSWSYSWEEGSTTGTKFNLKELLDGSKFDPSKMDYEKMSEEMMKEMGVAKVGTDKIMGKTCDKYEMNKEGMGKGTFWIWENISMKSETNMGGMNMVIEVTDINEKPNFDKNHFDVPTNINFVEQKMPERSY